MEAPRRKLLILDLDSTIIWSDIKEIRDFDTTLWLRKGTLPVWIKKRPHLDKFIDYIFSEYDVGVFSAAEGEYVREICKYVLDDRPLVFIMSGERCTQHLWYSKSDHQHYNIIVKKLQKIWDAKRYKNKYTKSNTLILDDSPETYVKNRGNAIPIVPYTGIQDTDVELLRTIDMLKILVNVVNVRHYAK